MPQTSDAAGCVVLFGASGTIGRAVAAELVAQGRPHLAVLRPGADRTGLGGATIAEWDARAPQALARIFAQAGPRASVVSCLASRSGAPDDARAVDRDLNLAVLRAAAEARAAQFVLLSAICVQRPRLAFQRAKLEFEAALRRGPMAWSIVRPTAYFKSLSGQWGRIRAGKPFLVFGDGALTACKPISDRDLARYLLCCLGDPAKQGQVLPIGGPGPALTPRAQAELMFAAAGRAPRIRRVPVALLRTIIGGLSLAGRVSARAREAAELARIGLYYGTESMLVWDPQAQAYDAAATPETGQDTLAGHYAQLATGAASAELGAHAVF